MKVEQRPSHFASGKLRNHSPVTQRPIPSVITSDRLHKSIALLAQYEYDTDQGKKQFTPRRCMKCNDYFVTVEGRDFTCKACNDIFCMRHRELAQHQCEKALSSYEKYLMAKSILKNKLKEVKSKGHA